MWVRVLARWGEMCLCTARVPCVWQVVGCLWAVEAARGGPAGVCL